MKRCILLLSSILFIYSSTYACGGLTQQAQGGELRYSFDSIDPMLCTITATMYFDINEPIASDSVYVSWGDGDLQYVFATSISEDTSIPAGLNTAPVYQHVYQATHRYDSLPGGGFYYPTLLLQYRPSFISNIANGETNGVSFYIESQVAPGLTGNQKNRGTIISAPFNLFGYVNDTFTYTPTFYDPDGDSVVFTAITPLQNHDIPVPQYVFPDSFCNYSYAGSSHYSVNPHTGQITWTSTCYQGLYTIAFQVSKYRNGQFIGGFVRDQNLYIVDKPIPSCNAYFTIYPDSAPHNWIILNQANGSPPVTYLWNWGDDSTSTGATPSHTYADSGYYDICLSIADAQGCTSTYCDSSTDLRTAQPDVVSVHVVTSLATAVTDVTNNNAPALLLFPNPVENTLGGTITGFNSGVALGAIYSLDGRLIINQVPLNEGRFQVDVSSLPPGMYLFQTIVNGRTLTQRFVKQAE